MANIHIGEEERLNLIEAVKMKYGKPLKINTFKGSYAELGKAIKSKVEPITHKTEDIGEGFLRNFFQCKDGDKKFRDYNIDILCLYAYGKKRADIVTKDNEAFYEIQFPSRGPLPKELSKATWLMYATGSQGNQLVLAKAVIEPQHNGQYYYKAYMTLGDSDRDYHGYAHYDKTTDFLILDLCKGKNESRDLRMVISLSVDGLLQLNVGKITYYSNKIKTFSSELVILEVKNKDEDFFIGIIDGSHERFDSIPMEVIDFLFQPTQRLNLPDNIFSFDDLRAFVHKYQYQTQALNAHASVSEWTGEYSLFMPGKLEGLYEPLYKNTFTIHLNGSVKYSNPFTGKSYEGIARLKSQRILQIALYDEENTGSIYIVVNLEINAYLKSVTFIPGTGIGLSADGESMVFHVLVTTEKDTEKYDPFVVEFFKNKDIGRVYSGTPALVEKIKVDLKKK